MKKRFLVSYDYGMGAVWAFIHARSGQEILDRFTELSINDSPPGWMKSEELDHIARTHTFDIDDPPSDFLEVLIESRHGSPSA